MNEKPPVLENIPELSLDYGILEQLDRFVKEHNEERYEPLKINIDAAKFEAFQYAEDALNLLLRKDIPKKYQSKHDDIDMSFWYIKKTLDTVGIPVNWPQEKLSSVKGISIEYAIRSALNYQKAVSENHMSPQEAFEAIGLSDVQKFYRDRETNKRKVKKIKPQFIENNILKKYNQLSDEDKKTYFPEINT